MINRYINFYSLHHYNRIYYQFINLKRCNSNNNEKNTFDQSINNKINKQTNEIILAFKTKLNNHNKHEDNDMIYSDMNIDILSLQNKTNIRLDDIDIDEDIDEERKKHIVPQHRKYLTNKQHDKVKLSNALEETKKYQLKRLGYLDDNRNETNLIRDGRLNSLIEDKIQLSILKGEFDNLSNAGKPLNAFVNPFVDSTTDLAYNILKKNNIKPEWIELQSLIHILKQDLILRIEIEWIKIYLLHNKIDISILSTDKLSNDLKHKILMKPCLDRINQIKSSYQLLDDVNICNKHIDRYNLQVPSYTLTRGQFTLDYEIDRCIDGNIYTHLSDLIERYNECVNRSNSYNYYRQLAVSYVHDKYSRINQLMRPDYSTSKYTPNNSYSSSNSTRDIISSSHPMIEIFLKPFDKLAYIVLKYISNN